MTLEQHEEVINVILLFNRYIKIYAEYYNFLIVNQYSETVDSDGSSNNKYHCDNRHLDCRILKIIERQVNQTYDVNKWKQETPPMILISIAYLETGWGIGNVEDL